MTFGNSVLHLPVNGFWKESKLGGLYHLPLLCGKFTAWVAVGDGRRNGSREGVAGVWKGLDGSKSGCFDTLQAVVTMGDVGSTLMSCPVLVLT